MVQNRRVLLTTGETVEIIRLFGNNERSTCPIGGIFNERIEHQFRTILLPKLTDYSQGLESFSRQDTNKRNYPDDKHNFETIQMIV